MGCSISNLNRCKRTSGTYCPWSGWTYRSCSTTSTRLLCQSQLLLLQLDLVTTSIAQFYLKLHTQIVHSSTPSLLINPMNQSSSSKTRSVLPSHTIFCFLLSPLFLWLFRLSEALQQPGFHRFIKATEKEWRDHIYCKHREVVPLKSIPVGNHAITILWSMK